MIRAPFLVVVLAALSAPVLAESPAGEPLDAHLAADEAADGVNPPPQAAQPGPAAAAPAPAAAAPTPAMDPRDIPPAGMGMGEVIGQLLKMVLMLGVVVALAYLTLSKGLGKLVERQNIGKRVKVVERVALDPKRSLFLVDIDGKQMLLGGGEGGVVFIKDVEARDPTAATQSPSRGFSERFSDALRTRVPGEPPVTTGLGKTLGKAADDKAGA